MTHRRAAWAAILAVAATLGAATLSACSDDDSSDADPAAATAASTAGGGAAGAFLEESQAAVEAARQPLTEFTGPDEPPGPVPPDKTVVAITCANAAPLCLNSAKGFVEAAEAVGWDASIVNGKSTPQGWADAVNTAVSAKVDAIYLASPVPSQIPEAIQRAADADIPVVSSLTCPEKLEPGVIAEFASDRHATGYILGQWVVQNWPEGTGIIEYTNQQFRCFILANQGFEAAIAQAGPSYVVADEIEAPFSDVTTPAGPQRAASAIRANPDAKAFYILSETWAGVLQQAVQQTEATDVVGLGIDSDFYLPQVRAGAKFVGAGPDTYGYGWWVVDALIRHFNGKPQIADPDIPFQLVNSTNADETDASRVVASYDYAAAWKQLWGVE